MVRSKDKATAEIPRSNFDNAGSTPATSTNFKYKTMSRNKFNGFEKWVIDEAVTEWVRLAENETIAAEQNGRRLIFASGYFEMVGKDLLDKVNSMTQKKYAN